MKSITLSNIIVLTLFLSSCSTSYLTNNQYTTSNLNNKSNLVNLKKIIKKPTKLPDVKKVELVKNEDVLKLFNDNIYGRLVNNSVENIFKEAKTYLGTPYRYGGTTRRGIDCSSFMQHIYKVEGIKLPRVSSRQARVGIAVSKDELRKGDLVFFSTTSRYRVTHVGMVTHVSESDIRFIHSGSSKGVSYASLNNKYWKNRYRGARRPHKLNDLTLVKNKVIDSLSTS